MDENQPVKRRRLLPRVLKWTGWTLLSIILLVLAVITVAVSYLKPERLTPLVEEVAGRFLDADITMGRVEISFYSTFPRFELSVRDLDVRTRAFDTLPDSVRSKLPAGADSLLRLEGLDAALNIPRLFTGTVELYDVLLTNPRANIVQATPEVSGLDIFPPSTDKTEGSGPAIIPDITFDTFRVDSLLAVRYVSLPDSMDVMARMRTLTLDGNGAPHYSLDIRGGTSATLAGLDIPLTDIGLDGRIGWSPRQPRALSLDGMKVALGRLAATFSSDITLSDTLTVNSFTFDLPVTPVNDMIALIPPAMRGELSRLDTDLGIGLAVSTTAPFAVGVDSIPSLTLRAEIPEGSARYDGMALDRFELRAEARIDGNDPDDSTLHLQRLYAQGLGIGFSLEGNVSHPLTDPRADGIFKGGLKFERLPKALLDLLPATLHGLLKADCTFALRRSWLDSKNFHKIRIKGSASLTDLEATVPDMELEAYSRLIELRFGTSSSFVRAGHSVDSLLTASLKLDTVSVTMPGLELRGSGWAAGVGCRNTGDLGDTTQITPIGARVTAGRVILRSEADSMRLRLRKATAGISLTRFKGESRRPRLTLDISADGALYGDRLNRAMLMGASTWLTVHPSTSAFNTRRLARIDSLRRLYPGLSRDSLEVLASVRRGPRRQVAADTLDADHRELDLEVDGSIRRILRRWEARGRLKADRMIAYTPVFPLRSRVRELDMSFSTDSVVIADTRVQVGHSDFLINGTVSNITRALTSRRGGADRPLRVNLDLSSDTIDINEIAAATFAGAAFAERDEAGAVTIAAPDDDSMDESSIGPTGQEGADSAAIFVIPSNVEATLNVNARNIVYSDLVFRNFKGVLNSYDGALNLSELTAHTDVGSIGLNALYSAPNRSEATFAFGLRINEFHIAEFLDLIPAIDSLMPLLNGIDGVINADLAATTALDRGMNLDIPSLKAAVKISGDSLVVIDDETFRTIGKWLMFKNKNRNMIDSMTVEMIVDNSQLRMFPFMFNFDRYRLGVMGSNDMAMNFNYHVAVLRSPLPFKFGINITGNPDDMKIRVGKAKFNEKDMGRTVSIADTTRVNLVNEIRNVFRRGVNKAAMKRLDFGSVDRNLIDVSAEAGDTISHADSLYFIRQGVLPPPPANDSVPAAAPEKKKRKNIFSRR